MEQFFIEKENIKGDCLFIRESEAHHLKDVLRYKKGGILNLFDGEGGVYRGEILELRGKEVKVKILNKKCKEKNPPFFHLVQAIPKREKMDLVVEKVTELGVEEIIPVITERTVILPDREKGEKLLERWRKISLSAVKQSKRLFLPKINEIKEWSQVFKEIPASASLFIPSLEEKGIAFKEIDWGKLSKDIYIFIGPEGDFTKKEIQKAKEKGAIPVSLGEAVLRSETAAIYLLSVLNYELKS
ncbi:MAG: 16S rRNA (uracil(1498)-N(3))-methyltransferase [Candidatus Omnitrophica bacterium]|nr:16S rRNA (uracil(1498)-N(3))-methyltransferase [Candidatus Omnitrophota bacterium]